MVQIHTRDRIGGTTARETAIACVTAGIEAAIPERAIRTAVHVESGILSLGGETFNLADYDRLLVLGGGKAGARMADALAEVLGEWIDRGVVITTADETDPTDADPSPDMVLGGGRIDIVGAGHPIPDTRGIEGTQRVLNLADDATGDDLVIALISGGGSALLSAPAADIDLPALQAVTDALLAAGAPIAAINAVRKHCSRIKGGHLARRVAPATLVTLAISDVVGNDPGVIASGPTVPDPTTYDEASGVLAHYGIDVPTPVADHLSAGDGGTVPETPAPGDPVFDRTSYHIVADAMTAIDAARRRAGERGYNPLVLATGIRGEASEAAISHVAVAESVRDIGEPVEPPAVILSGGETTVTVTGDGRGGPNGEFALSGAIEFVTGPGGPFGDDIALASVDTDGRDGPGGGDTADDSREVPAGALVDGTTVDDPGPAHRALSNNDSHGYLGERAALVRTGPTGTNVNDLRVLVVEPR